MNSESPSYFRSLALSFNNRWIVLVIRKGIWQPFVLLLAFVIARQNYVASERLKRSVVNSKDVSGLLLTSICNIFKDLNKQQHDFCQQNWELMEPVKFGVDLAKKECANQFRHERWNCSVAQKSTLLWRMSKLATKEAAFNYALVSAGIVHVIARECMKGSLTKCGCSAASRPPSLAKKHKWGGCGDNIAKGIEFSKNILDYPKADELTDKTDPKIAAKVLMDLHNSEAGRQAILKTREKICKCHGVTNACIIETCWYQVSSFNKIGDYLKEKYNNALRFKDVKRKNGKYRVNLKSKPSNVNELVYVDASPNYCNKYRDYFSLGTVGRQCNTSSTGSGSCNKLCCGRGYKTKQITVSYQCRCNFVWCCTVKCDMCSKVVNVHTCK